MDAFGYIGLALGLALLAPLALIATRYELQRVRAHVVNDLKATLFKDQQELPQIALVAARYRGQGPDNSSRQEEVMEWTGAFFFALVCFAGFMVLFVPVLNLVGRKPEFPIITFSVFWGQGQSISELIQSVRIAGVAFLGGYIFQVRYLSRATLNQELSALAFVRAALTVLQGIFLAVVAFQVGGAAIGEAISDGGEGAGRLFGGALGAAFAIGCWPDLGLAQLATIVRARTKGVDVNALEAAKKVPLEIIDGIDSEISFRLQESNLYDIQNLATINPIELYAETPFTLFQTFDWVLQAQLCLICGPAVFKELKSHNIRTIFDLERAVLAEGAPESYVQAIGLLLFRNAGPEFRTRVGLVGQDGAIRFESTISTAIVRHAVAIVGDDLHIHRLRALWHTILFATAGKDGPSLWLYDTGPLPGEPARSDLGLAEPAASAVRLADGLARQFAIDAAPATRTACLEAVRNAMSLNPSAKERLRLLWNPGYLRKRPNEAALEIFFGDPEFDALLA